MSDGWEEARIIKELEKRISELEEGAGEPFEDVDETALTQLHRDVLEHGEVHATIAEIGQKDIRSGDAEFDHDVGLVTIRNEDTTHRVSAEHIIHWCKPRDF